MTGRPGCDLLPDRARSRWRRRSRGQPVVTPAMQGRVFTLVGSLATAMMPLSLAVAGPVSDLIGVRFWFVFGGATLTLLGAAAFFVPAIIRLEEGRQGRPVLEQAAGPAG